MGQQSPIGYQAKGILSGFAALYGIFTVGCIVLLVVAVIFLNSWEQLIAASIFGVAFLGLVIYALVLHQRDPNTFITKETQEVIVTINQVKSPQEQNPRTIISKPVPPLPNQKSTRKKLKP